MKKKKLPFIALVILLSALIFGAVQTQEAIAVGPCGTVCDDPADCFKQCACETPEWGVRVMPCAFCSWAPGNACT